MDCERKAKGAARCWAGRNDRDPSMGEHFLEEVTFCKQAVAAIGGQGVCKGSCVAVGVKGRVLE